MKIIRTMFILLLMALIISGCTNTKEHLNDTATKTSEIHEENAKALFREYT